MYKTYFIVPKEVFIYCVFPALAIIIFCLLFWLIYRKKKELPQYAYTLNSVYNIASILICLLLFPLLLGYSVAMLDIINRGILEKVNILIKALLVFLPIIPFGNLLFVLYRFIKNMQLKESTFE